MAENEKPASKFFWIVVGGLISLLVGIGSALAVNYATEKRPQMAYDITSEEVFPGEENKLGILAMQVSNTGGIEIEDLQCRVDLNNATLTEPRCKGLSPDSYKMENEDSYVEVTAPFLNPGESFSLQMLLKTDGDSIISLRLTSEGRGCRSKEIGTRYPKYFHTAL